jgi:sugar lactone lactonase YvrE
VLLIFAGLAFLTARAAFRASYINYDSATEYLVYAHMARGPKEILEQVEQLSLRLTDSNDIQVAYDNETTYPFWWYFRNFPNNRYYADQPGRDLRDFPVIVVGDTNYGKIEPVVGDSYYMFEYTRIWWPNQDYFDFTRDSISSAYAAETGLPADEMPFVEYLKRVWGRLYEYLGDPQMRVAIWNIWLNRDFGRYLELKGQDPSPAEWNPRRTMRMYIRKDIAAQIWDLGVQAVTQEEFVDPYEGKGIQLPAELALGEAGNGPSQFNSPRNLSIAPDGSVYVADSNNHRIQHFASDGTFLEEWGSFADSSQGQAPGGTFFEPWSVAVSPDGRFVYVVDTWNHRIQKFGSRGQFLTMWGAFGQDDGPYSMWGPRDLVVDAEGNVLVVDTGNKRIKVYDADGNFISQYGEFGLGAGQFDEPVGIALDSDLGQLYVADTWNQRVQVFNYAGGSFTPAQSWDIAGWYGQSLLNKPFLSVGARGLVYITDPEAGRVLVYQPDGAFVHFFGGFDQSAVVIGVAQGVEASADGSIWLTDSQNNRLLRFVAP